MSATPSFSACFPRWPPRPLRDAAPSDATLDDAGIDLLGRMLRYAPETRVTAAEALGHEYFAGS